MADVGGSGRGERGSRTPDGSAPGGGIGGSKWVAPLLPADFEPPIGFRWPEYVTTARGVEWWIPTPGDDATAPPVAAVFELPAASGNCVYAAEEHVPVRPAAGLFKFTLQLQVYLSVKSVFNIQQSILIVDSGPVNSLREGDSFVHDA